jgi:hypothetical protein
VTTVAVAGALAGKPGNGGEAWVRLSYALGLRRLGFEVRLLEAAPGASDDAVAYARETATTFGLDYALADESEEGADLLLNISGNLRSRELLGRFRRTAFVDIDPGFTQMWHVQGIDVIPPHDVYFTIAENIRDAGCSIPAGGIEWRPTRPPVVLEEWPSAADGFDRFTTVATWRGPYGRIEHGGRTYGIKLDEFRKVLELPALTRETFELALDIHPAEKDDLAALDTHGWRLVDPDAVAAGPDPFRRYVQGSGAEFSVTQAVYIETGSGWFSDRTTRYLASAKPALVQDTGFSRAIPTGEGLFAFRTVGEAVESSEEIAANYGRHSLAARRIAEEYFDSDDVLGRLLEQALE